jgi:hypothetical protein
MVRLADRVKHLLAGTSDETAEVQPTISVII